MMVKPAPVEQHPLYCVLAHLLLVGCATLTIWSIASLVADNFQVGSRCLFGAILCGFGISFCVEKLNLPGGDDK